MNDTALPTLFIPHGAGPCFFMDWKPAGTWDRMAAWLGGMVAHVGTKPEAIVVVSAHWEAPAFAVNAARAPGLLYDYTGFPAHTYRIAWPARGAPARGASLAAARSRGRRRRRHRRGRAPRRGYGERSVRVPVRSPRREGLKGFGNKRLSPTPLSR